MATHVVLVHPEIHWNTGNAGRTCLAAGATLHLIEPLGFSLDEREVKRAGLDYWEQVDLRVWTSWSNFERELLSLGEPFFFSTKATRLLWDAPLGASNDIVLIFGRETGGLPAELHERYRDRFVGMPMHSPRVRSLNLSTSVGIALYELLRQRRDTRLRTAPPFSVSSTLPRRSPQARSPRRPCRAATLDRCSSSTAARRQTCAQENTVAPSDSPERTRCVQWPRRARARSPERATESRRGRSE